MPMKKWEELYSNDAKLKKEEEKVRLEKEEKERVAKEVLK
jgi:hypothetical protein